MKQAPPTMEEAGRPLRSPITGLFCSDDEYESDREHVMDQRRSDIAHVEKTIKGLREPDEHVDCDGDGISCDCFVSEIVMLSTGYAEVWRDGDVVQSGKVVYKEDQDA